jgi:heme-degrading monooxygenase HmoA
MIRVIIEYQSKGSPRFLALLRDIRVQAMKQPSYVSGETLVNTEDRSSIVVISTWQSLKEWRNWRASETRAKLEKETEAFLLKEPNMRTYRYLSYLETRSKK